MKKVTTLLLSLMLVLSIFTPLAASAEWEQGNDVDLRVGILNDSHITQKLNTIDIVRDALSSQMAIGGGKLDGLALVGDVVYYPKATDDPTENTHYTALYEAINEIMPDVPVAYAIGSHEFPQSNNTKEVSDAGTQTFIDATGQQINHHTKFGDYHFIAGGGYGYSGKASDDTLAWLMNEIDAAIAEDSTNAVDGKIPEGVIPDSQKPVFLLLHYPIDATIFNKSYGIYSKTLKEFLQNRPQVINITAHMHIPANLPQTIWQDGFTVYQSPLTSGGYLTELDSESTGNYSNYYQGSMIEIVDNVVYLKKLNYNEKTYIGTPWIIDVPAIVADKTDDNPDNDLDHYYYSADKRTESNVPAFPEGSEVTVEASTTAMNVTYPNNAVMTATGAGLQQDGFTRGYKVDVVADNGTIVQSKTYMTDFYKAEADRSETFTRLISGVAPGTHYTVKVYPQSPLGMFGEPIVTEVTTDAVAVPNNSIRYEFDDFYPNKSVVKTSDLASGGKLVSSNQAGMVKDYTVEARNTEDPIYDFTFEIEVPFDDTYKIEYAASYHENSTYVSYMDFYIDDELFGKNDGNFDYDMSMGDQYPWEHTPMYHYTGESLALTAGKHTVKVEIHLPTTTEKEQPFLFAMDYLQLTPETAILTPNTVARAEFENYKDSVGTIPNADETVYTPNVVKHDGASNGAYLQIDSEAVAEGTTAEVRVPINVKTAGKYRMDFVAIQCSPIAVYLDNKDGENLAENAQMLGLDEKNADGKYPTFNNTWSQAKSYICDFTVSEGAHELIFELSPRDKYNDIAQYMDYVEFSSAVEYIEPGAIKTIEIEKYAAEFSPIQLTRKISFNASGGAYTHVDTETDDNHQDLVAEVEIFVERAGNYALEYVASNVGSAIEIAVDGQVLNTEVTATSLDALDETLNVYPYFNERYHAAKKYNCMATLPQGEHILEIRMKTRPEKDSLDVAGCMDYVSFRCTDAVVSTDYSSKIEFEDYWHNCIHEGGKYSVGSHDGASAGSYGYTGNGGTETATLTVPFFVEKDGVYSLEYVAAGASHLSNSYLYFDSLDAAPVFTVTGSTGTDISEGRTIFSKDYPARKYTGKVVLTAGEHNVIIKADPRNTEILHDVAFALDYLSFTPADDTVTFAEGIVTAMVAYDTPQTGTAVLAVYDGAKLVSVNAIPVKDLAAFTVSAEAASATKAKVMMIDAFSTLAPKAAVKTLIVK